MKIYIKLLKYYLNFLSYVFPRLGGKVAIHNFQKIRLRKIKPKEAMFYTKTTSYQLINKYDSKTFTYYELGNPKGELVFLIHGWDSNAGSLSQFAFEFAKKNYRVISLDLPAHAYSKGTHTNLFICKYALISLINHINPHKQFNIIGHSFGAAVAVYALAELNLPVNKIVLLSANNKMQVIFKDYQKFIGFNDVIYHEIAKWVKNVLNEKLENLVLSDRIKQINYQGLKIIHDKYDKVIPFESAVEIKTAIPNAKLVPFEKIGHYRMLWNEDVLTETQKFIAH